MSPTMINKTASLHPRNSHQGRYDFEKLCTSCPELAPFLVNNPSGGTTIDFSDSQAVLYLNKALLAHHYQISNWQIPDGYLCPPIPGRADYIHHIADLLTSADNPEVPTGKNVNVLDIGTGANCIYPIIGSRSYGWKFVATDIDPIAVNVAEVIVQSNPQLNDLVKLRLQQDENAIFDGIIGTDDYFDLTMCNPPFHASVAEAQAANQRKRINLNKKKKKSSESGNLRNFGGQNKELWCADGEMGFLTRMINESARYSRQVSWFTSLVSKGENLPQLKKQLTRAGAEKIKIVAMSQGQKTSRLLAWNF
jgi:23S rRNA (adenine1618-N6)-methyltransferase